MIFVAIAFQKHVIRALMRQTFHPGTPRVSDAGPARGAQDLGAGEHPGEPIVLGSNILEGLITFFKEPLKARNPKHLASGIAKGSLALVKFSTFGFLEAIGQVPPPPPLLLGP
jgi:hypothetical protein